MGRVLERYAGSGLRLVGNHLGMDQNDSEADEKDHAQRRAAERMAPKQEMRQQSAQQKNKKCDDQWVAHGGRRCLQKPDHLAASPVMLCAALILNPDRWGRQPAHRQALDRTRVHAPVASRTAISPDGPWEAAGVRAGGDRPREWPLHGPRLVLGVADRRAGRAPQGARYWQGSDPSRAGRLSRTSSTLTMSG